MRRTARALSVAALVVLAGAAPARAADDPADPVDPLDTAVEAGPGDPAAPAAQISPASVEPGGTVTVSVTCDPTGGPAPESIDASSEAAFADGTVKLQKVPGGDDELSGPAYKGTATIVPAEDLEGLAGGGSGAGWTVDGTCPAPPGGKGRPWSTTFSVAHASHGATSASACPDTPFTPCKDKDDTAGTGGKGEKPLPPGQEAVPPEPGRQQPTARPPAIEHGVHAGEGGSFTTSAPALVAGGLLILGAAGAAAHRMRQRERDRA
ncbi:hypothetical protein AB0E88_10630 [Streptomyces sp. NPDC028635]|uniref:hypothetical protein n=1 Tax=Streptomyces sp. NPDC028635 TaxID=3154800 RepID=UPI0033FB6201